MGDFVQVLVVLVEAGAIVLAGSVMFDAIHWLLHRFSASRWSALRAVGALHEAHHRFLDRSLTLHPDQAWRNMRFHLVPELLTQVAVAGLFAFVFDAIAVVLAMCTLIAVFLVVTVGWQGRDPNHRPPNVLKAPLMGTWVEPSYHMLHHVHPDSYFSSLVQVFDKLFGTGCQIAGRTVAMTGASGAFGAPLKELLEKAGATVVTLKHGVDWSYERVRDPHTDDASLDDLLRRVDILALCHGSKMVDAMDANCTSFVGFIERFKRLTADRRCPPEVWAVGSEIEAHPDFGIPELKVYKASKGAYARHARRYFHDRSLVYRHVVPSAFTSVMGPGLISGRLAARIAFALIRRGVRYVPVTYTGIAFLNFPSYLVPFGADPAPPGSVDRVRAGQGARPLRASPVVGIALAVCSAGASAPAVAKSPSPMAVHVTVDLQGEHVDDVVATWFSEHFADAAVKVSNLKWRKLLEDSTRADATRVRRVRMEPDIQLPNFIEAIVAREPIIYDEVGTYEPAARVLTFTVQSKARESIRYAGRMRFEPTPAGARVHFEAGVEVDGPPGVSHVVTSIVEGGVKDGYVRIGTFLREYLVACRSPRSQAGPGACAAAASRRALEPAPTEMPPAAMPVAVAAAAAAAAVDPAHASP